MKIALCAINAKFIHTCLAIRYLKAYCQHEAEIELCEYTIKDPTMHIAQELYTKHAAVYGFSCYIWNIEETIKTIHLLKKMNPQAIIILGGPEVSYDSKEWMEKLKEVDMIIMGEGEQPLLEYIQYLKGKRKITEVSGIIYRIGDQLGFQPQGPKIDLSKIPSPYRFKEDLPNLSKRITYFETSRGCPFRCQFCLSSIETGVRYFDTSYAKREILYLIEHGAKLIKFVDRTFNIKREYALEMFEFLIQNHGGCVFQFEITADIMRPEVLDYLAEHAPPGVFRFEIGVQSTNDMTNKLVQRRQNFTKLSRTVTTIKNAKNIDQHLDLIAGLPEEDYESFSNTFDDVFALRPEELQLGFLKMLRGTGLRNQSAEWGYVYSDFAPYEIVRNDALSPEDMGRIRQAEDTLEKYWNAHRMDYTLEFLLRTVYTSPFRFFQSFGEYWAQKGWEKIGHQLEDLFIRLYEFCPERKTTVLDIMKVDYFLHHKYKPRKVWWENSLNKQEISHFLSIIEKNPAIVGEAFMAIGLDEKQLHKHVVLEKISFSFDALQRFVTDQSQELELDPHLAIAIYANEKKNLFTVPIAKFHEPLSVLQASLS